jgi:hypothetical protein
VNWEWGTVWYGKFGFWFLDGGEVGLMDIV